MNTYKIFEALAATTWHSLSRALDRRIQLGEDAITTYNLLTIDTALPSTVIVEDTCIDEASKGADWEFWVGRDKFGWYRYAVQAKRLGLSRNRYNSLAHKVGGVSQIDILDKYAIANRAAPIYCFYNFIDSSIVPWNCTIIPFEIEQLGCSISPSYVVRNALGIRGGRTFEYIHQQPETLPWRCLVKCPLLTTRLGIGKDWPLMSGIDNYFQELPRQVRILKETRDPSALMDISETFNPEIGLRPRWVGIIQLDDDDTEYTQ